MKRKLSARADDFALAKPFRIASGPRTHMNILTVEIEEDGIIGYGEGVPYYRQGEQSPEILEQIQAVRDHIENGATRMDIQSLMKPGPGRNAVDCALWDLDARKEGVPLWYVTGLDRINPVPTMRTISIDTPEKMAEEAIMVSDFSVLKIKLGSDDDMARLRAVYEARPDALITIDANQGWSKDYLLAQADDLASVGVVMVEQPLPIGQDAELRGLGLPFKLCADESARTRADIEYLANIYDMVNIKLDKAGGLTEAVRMKRKALDAGLEVMTGCMICTSLSIRPALILAQDCTFADLDGPLWLKEDRGGGVRFEKNLVIPQP